MNTQTWWCQVSHRCHHGFCFVTSHRNVKEYWIIDLYGKNKPRENDGACKALFCLLFFSSTASYTCPSVLHSTCSCRKRTNQKRARHQLWSANEKVPCVNGHTTNRTTNECTVTLPGPKPAHCSTHAIKEFLSYVHKRREEDTPLYRSDAKDLDAVGCNTQQKLDLCGRQMSSSAQSIQPMHHNWLLQSGLPLPILDISWCATGSKKS